MDAAANGDSVTVDGTAYTIKNRIQLSKGGEAGKYSVSFTVGKNTTSIGVLAKHSSSGGSDPVVLATEAGAKLTTWTVTQADGYKAYTFDATGKFTENTKVYVYNSGSTGGVNMKAIWAEPVVEETITFTSAKKTVANTEANLGIAGTTASSSDEAVATVEITTAGVVVTSKKEGSATITVKDGTKEASFPVTVGKTGEISVGTITKYEAPSINVQYTSENLAAGTVTATISDKSYFSTATALTATIKGETSTTTLAKNSGAAGTSYAGYKATSGTALTYAVGDEVGCFEADITTAKALTLKNLNFIVGSSSFAVKAKAVINDGSTDIYTSDEIATTDTNEGKTQIAELDLNSLSVASGKTLKVKVYVYAGAAATTAKKANMGINSLKLTAEE